MDSKYRPHSTKLETRADGTMVFRSAYVRSPVVAKTSDWLHHWARMTPNATFIADRSGDGWREESFLSALQIVQALGEAMLARGMGQNTPILIISGNSVDHGLLTLAAQYVGVPTVPVAEQYALIPGAHRHLRHVISVTDPGMIFAEDGDRVAEALALNEMHGREIVISRGQIEGATMLADMLKGANGVDLAAANAAVGPDTVAKYLMTSGSTSAPKAVITTQRMMCTNQAQLLDTLPFLKARPPVIVDWLPWNHVFGGSHNFNLMLANGGSLYIDDGKPTPDLFPRTLENLRMKTGTLAFNVPVGYAKLLEAMRADKALAESYFAGLDMLFYAGAALPQDVWKGIEDLAKEVTGHVPLMNSSWGLTETAPAALIQHEPTHMSGIVGVPLTGLDVKLVPVEDARVEVRVKGDSIMPGYLNEPEKTAEAFDEDGFFRTGDVMAFVDPADPDKGLRFVGRLTEEFKLTSGTWVRAATLRLDVLGELGGIAADLVITGANRSEIGVMIFPNPATLKARGITVEPGQEVIIDPALAEDIRAALAPRLKAGSSARISRALVLAEPASLPEGEITAKGNLNSNKILSRRAHLEQRLYDDSDPATILI
ncbi:feruloyl-CoA synthase [Mesobacterium pallidum]|uniref:feruloyl-CoA synthase n=1 Tax=Mesobacterium pallidum TaxID=2872037 RepID=UPI001EE2E7AB|nr:feruloyl-CoA synthase [Mesobacterium pallidum]